MLSDDYWEDGSGRSNCMIPHMVFLSIMVSNWQEYIEYLHSDLLNLIERPDSTPII